MMKLSKWLYYLSSIGTLAIGMKNWWTMTAAFLNLPIKRPFLIVLRNGLQFEARTGLDVWVIKESCLDRDYEHQSVQIQDGWTIIDIGAALGDFAIHAARKTPSGRVYAYEPAHDSFQLLQRNIMRNQTHNVETFPYAVNGTGDPMVLDTGEGNLALYKTISANGSEHEKNGKVDAVTLDQVFSLLKLNHCDFLKIDCEGGEYDLLFHTSDSTLLKLRHICLEYHEGVTEFTHHDLVQFFENKGFMVRHTPNPVHEEIGFLYAYR